MIIFILKHRIPVLISGIVLTLLLGFNVIYLSIDGSFSTVLPDNDSVFLYNRYVEKTFGNSDELIILIKNDRGIYNSETIQLIKDLSDELSDIEEVDKDRLMSIVHASDSDTAGLKDFIENDPFISDFLVGENDKSTLIVAPVSNEIALSDAALRSLAERAVNLIEKYREKYPKVELFITGHPIVNAEIVKKMANDLYVLFPLAILAVALMLLYILRSFRGMLIPLTITFASIIWTFGLKGLLRSNLTITETVIPVILISIACADGIHIVSEAFHFMHRGLSSRSAIIRTMKNLWKPIVLTSITTAIGFASFVFSPGRSLRNMGLFLAFGVLIAMVFSLVYIPIMLSWYKPLKEHKDRKHYAQQYHILKTITAVIEIVLKKKVPLLITTALLLGISIWGMLNINTDTDEVRYFKKDNPIRQSAEIIENELGGISVLQIVLESEEPGTFKKLENLGKIGKLQDILDARPEVSQTISIADYISYLYYRLRGSRLEYFEVPQNQLFLIRMLKLVENNDDPRSRNIFAFIDEDFRRAKISVRLTDSNTRAMEKLLLEIEPHLASLFDDSIKIGYAGDYLRLRNGRVIVESQVFSLTTTIIIIVLVLSILFRSFVSGFIVSIPVIIAVFFNFAIMWLFSVSLNPATSIIAAVGLGVGVDYSIHLFSRFNILYNKSGHYHESLINSVSETARGILSNALSVGLGFLVLLFSAYRIINDMGWIIALSMITTSVASLVLLPILISLREKSYKRRLIDKKKL